MSASVYFLRCGEFVKIGHSVRPQQRLAALQTVTPHETELLAMLPGTHADERAAHRALRHLHHRNERFKMSPDVIAYIEAIKARGLSQAEKVVTGGDSIASILSLFSPKELSQALSIPESHARTIKARGSIAVTHWPALVACAPSKGILDLSTERLLELRYGKPLLRSAAA